MKKITQIIALFLTVAAAASCDMFELDSYEGPNAQVTGRFLDAKTGELMGIESSVYSYWDWGSWSMKSETAGALIVIEQGWKDKDGNPVSQDQNWLVRFDGKYTNNLVFAAEYKIDTKNLPCYPPSVDGFTLKKGANTVDFTVTPFCRILNEKIVYNEASKKLVATFQVELGDDTKANSINNIAFCANTQLFVGCNYFNLAKDDPGAKKTGGFDWATWSTAPACEPGETVTLEINLEEPKNAELFKYSQDRYVRIAAQAGGNNYNGQSYYNFSKIYRVSADYKTIEPVVWQD